MASRMLAAATGGALRAGMEVGDGGSAATTSGPVTVGLARQGKPHHPCRVLAAGEPLAQRRALLDGDMMAMETKVVGAPVGTEGGTPGLRVSATVGGCAGRGPAPPIGGLACCGIKCEGHAGTWGRESVVGPAQSPPERVARLNRRESVPYAGALRCAVISSLAPAMPHYPNANASIPLLLPSPTLVLLQGLHCQNGQRGVP